MILASIDIGSNASRMIICDVHQYKDGSIDFVKLNLLRIPLRLGFEVFQKGKISSAKQQMIIDTMKAYKQLYKIYKVDEWVACATAAMREAKNGKEIIQAIKKETGIGIQILSGAEEASVLYDAHLQYEGLSRGVYLYIDVGGGSAELTLFNKKKLISKKSFNIGTIRILTDLVKEETWDELKKYCKDIQKTYPRIKMIGTGGNINKVFSLSKTKEGKPLSSNYINSFYQQLASCSLEERMHIYHLREDRADVIVPALYVFNLIMKWTGINRVYVPKMSLADGLIRNLYTQLNQEQD